MTPGILAPPLHYCKPHSPKMALSTVFSPQELVELAKTKTIDEIKEMVQLATPPVRLFGQLSVRCATNRDGDLCAHTVQPTEGCSPFEVLKKLDFMPLLG